MQARAAHVLAVALLGLSAALGCFVIRDEDPDVGCTAMACDDGLSISFTSSVKTAGTYDFELVADGQTIRCTTALPLAPCGSSSKGNCDAAAVGVLESGCALPAAEQSLEGISLTGMHPASLEMTVKRDGAEVAKQTLSPTYQRSAPNGEECGPICMQASASLAVK